MIVAAGGCRTNQNSSTPNQSTSEARPTTASAAPVGRYGTLSNDNSYFVTYTPTPDPIPLNKMFELSVRVCSAQDRSRPLLSLELHADAAMPEHDHGMNTKPKVRVNADGSFTVKGMLFHMPGRWELYLDVTRAGVTERAQFEVQLE